MPQNRYQKALVVLAHYKGRVLGADTLRRIIAKELGADVNRTVVPYLKMMREQGLIQELPNLHFRILP